MATNVIMTIHPDSASGIPPLPIREANGAHATSAAGHCVCLFDWALLSEVLMVRLSRGVADTFDAYPNGQNISTLGGWMDHFQAANYLRPSQATASDNVLRATGYLDTAWDFASERFAIDAEYSPFDFCHGVPLSYTPMTSTTPRLLDALRRRYYDAKRCTRIVAPSNRITFSTNWDQGYGFNPAGVSPREYTWNNGSTVSNLSFDAASVYHPTVVAHSAFRSTPVRILGYHQFNNGNAQASADQNYYRTVWLPVSTAGVVDTTAITASACRTAYEAEFGPGATGDSGSFVAGGIYQDHSQHWLAVYDITFPLDSVLAQWTWTPS